MEVARELLYRYGVIAPHKTRREVRGIVEKPAPREAPSNLAVIGRYLITPDVMIHLAKCKPGARGEIQFTDALDAIAREGGLEFEQFDGRRYDCGDKLSYLQAIVHSALANADFRADFEEILKDALDPSKLAAE